MKVRCRMAPSPTGKLHIGTAHTALFNFLFAKHHGGDFILRIDDSDPTRSKKEFEDDIVNSLKWLGITWDEGPDVGGPFAPYRQSQRLGSYQKYLDQLLEAKKAYRCFCSKEELEEKKKAVEAKGEAYIYDGKCKGLTAAQIQNNLDAKKPFVVRLINPNKTVTFKDMVRGEISVDSQPLGDFILARSDGSPLLNFAVVIDDIEYKITHAIRGEDFLNATPYQILIYEALGVAPPEIANLSFIYAPDHTKLSKRHGATGISEFRELGYLSEAMVNFLAFLGWNPGDDREIFDLAQLIKEFDFDKVQKGAPTFNKAKLDWYNQHYIQNLAEDDLVTRLSDFTKQSPAQIKKVLPLVRDRMVTLKDFDSLTDFFWKKPSQASSKNPEVISHAVSVLEESWDGKILEERARAYCAQKNLKVGDYFMALRVAITGKTATPPLWDVMQILGKEETLLRLHGH